MSASPATQLALPLPRGRGGRRKHAGRKPGPGRRSTPHRRRAKHVGSHPVHVTLRTRRGLTNLRSQVPFAVIVSAIKLGQKPGFRVVHFSVQRDHVHLICEAGTTKELSSGMRGLAIRMARALNRIMKRKGTVWGDRWHGRALASPREVRNALVYVIFNGHKHGEVRRGLDPFASILSTSSAPLRGESLCNQPAAPQTWLLATGWTRHGPVSPSDEKRMVEIGRRAIHAPR